MLVELRLFFKQDNSEYPASPLSVLFFGKAGLTNILQIYMFHPAIESRWPTRKNESRWLKETPSFFLMVSCSNCNLDKVSLRCHSL